MRVRSVFEVLQYLMLLVLSFNHLLQTKATRVTDLKADGAHVIVLLQLLSCGSGQGVDLLSCFLSEQEAPPARLSSEPNVKI